MLEKIKKLLLQGSNVIYDTNISIENYEQVLKMWLNYKKTGKIYLKDDDLYLVKSVFDFHKKEIDHIILYFSKELLDCLLLCRINGKYKNILIPAEQNILDLNKSFIAVYC